MMLETKIAAGLVSFFTPLEISVEDEYLTLRRPYGPQAGMMMGLGMTGTLVEVGPGSYPELYDYDETTVGRDTALMINRSREKGITVRFKDRLGRITRRDHPGYGKEIGELSNPVERRIDVRRGVPEQHAVVTTHGEGHIVLGHTPARAQEVVGQYMKQGFSYQKAVELRNAYFEAEASQYAYETLIEVGASRWHIEQAYQSWVAAYNNWRSLSR